jgi:hypothetical protein
MKQNQLIAIIFIILAASVILLSFGFDQTGFRNDFSGPGFFPQICAAALILLSLFLFFYKKDGFFLKNFEIKKFRTPIIGVSSLIIYILLLRTIGFTISSFILIIFFLLLFGVRKPILIPFFALVTAWGVNFIFNNLLAVSLPEGIFTQKFQTIIFIITGVYIVIALIIKLIKRGK